MSDSPPLLRLRSLRSCLGLASVVVGGLAALFVLASRKTPEAWRSRLEAAGALVVLEEARAAISDDENAALAWRAFEERRAAGEPVFLHGRSIARELFEAALRPTEAPAHESEATLSDWTLARSMQAMRHGAPTAADRALLAAGLELVRDDLDELPPLLERPGWAFDEPRAPWDPRERQARFPRLSDGDPARVVGLGARVELLQSAIEWSSVRALFAAERDDPGATGRWLLVAWHLIDGLRSEPFAPEFRALLTIEPRFLETLDRALPRLEATPEALALERRLAAVDRYAGLAAVLATRRVEMLEWFEREPGTPTHIGDGLRRWVHWCAFGYDVQTVATTFSEAIAALEGPRPSIWPHVGPWFQRAQPDSWLTPSVARLFGGVLEFQGILERVRRVQTRHELLHVALTARLFGRAAALAAADELRDPMTGAALFRATADDGALRLWTTGRNAVDDRGGKDDEAVLLPPNGAYGVSHFPPTSESKWEESD